METKRVRCHTCNTLLQLQTPPYVQTFECPKCHQFNHFKFSSSTRIPARVHSFPPARDYYAGSPTQNSYYSPITPSPTYHEAPPSYNYHPTAPRPPPSYSRPTPSSWRPYDVDAYNPPALQRPHPRPSMYEDNEHDYHYRPGAFPRPSFYGNNETEYYHPAGSNMPSTYGQNGPAYYRPDKGSYVERPLAPSLSQPASAYGKKRAVLCGVSYYGSNHELKGSVNDVKRMKYFLTGTMGFPDDCVLTLTENEAHQQRIPTRRNIQRALNWLVQGVQPEDSLVFYYTGLGSSVHDMNHDEIDGYDEALCPLDYMTQGKIVDDEINEFIVRPLPYGAKLHAIVDASHSGTILDLPFVCRMNRIGQYAWENQKCGTYKGTRGGLAVSITACDDDESTDDPTAYTGSSIGSLTHSFIQAVETPHKLTYGSLLTAIRSSLQSKLVMSAYDDLPQMQEPQLSASEKIDVNTRKFVL